MGKNKKPTSLNDEVRNQAGRILKVETITNGDGRKVRIIRSPGSICLADALRPEVTDEQLSQLTVNPRPFPE